jgi:hypothetical protein
MLHQNSDCLFKRLPVLCDKEIHEGGTMTAKSKSCFLYKDFTRSDWDSRQTGWFRADIIALEKETDGLLDEIIGEGQA